MKKIVFEFRTIIIVVYVVLLVENSNNDNIIIADCLHVNAYDVHTLY